MPIPGSFKLPFGAGQRVEEHLKEHAVLPSELVNPDDADLYNHAFWINDLLLVVPPSQISIDTDYTVFQWKSLRTNTTVKTHSGRSSTYIKLDLIIPEGNSIINVNRVSPSRTGQRGGVIDLILQFKYTPFCYIENAFLRSNVGLESSLNMAATLHQMNLSTVPQFPGALHAEILLGLFNYRPYGPNFVYKSNYDVRPLHGGTKFRDVNPSIIGIEGDIGDFNSNGLPTTLQNIEQETDPIYDSSGVISNESSIEHRNPNGQLLYEVDRGVVEPELSEISTGVDNPTADFVPLADTWGNEDMQDSDIRLMSEPVAVRTPAMSDVYTGYIDWLRTQWQQQGFGELQEVGNSKHNLGDKLIFRWREYTKISMPEDVFKSLRFSARRLVEDRTTGFPESESEIPPWDVLNAIRDELAAQPPASVPVPRQTLEQYFVQNGLPPGWAQDVIGNNNPEDVRAWWPRIIPTLRVLDAIQKLGDISISLNSGLRSGTTSDSVSGTSTHDTFEGVDFSIVSGSGTNRLDLANILIGLYYLDGLGSIQKLGIGMYLEINGDIRNSFHLDANAHGEASRRRWVWRGRNEDIRLPDQNVERILYPDQYRSGRNRGDAHPDAGQPVPNATTMRSIAEVWDYIRAHNYYTAIQSQSEGISVSGPDDGTNYVNADDVRRPQEWPQLPAANEEPEQVIGPDAPSEDVEEFLRDSRKYRRWVADQTSKGYVHYRQDISILDIFFVERELVFDVTNDHVNPSILNQDRNALCTEITAQLVNLFKELPLNGHVTPTAQFLGGMDVNYNVQIICNSLEQLQRVKLMRSTLETQQRTFRQIPDSWTLYVENPFINVFGTKSAVISSDQSDTIPGSPGSYNIQLSLLGHNPWQDRGSFTFIGVGDPEAVYKAFLQDLVEQGYLHRRENDEPTFINRTGQGWNASPAASLTAIADAQLREEFGSFLPPIGLLADTASGFQNTVVANVTGLNEHTDVDELKDTIVRLKAVTEQINQSLLRQLNGIDIGSLDFLGLGSSLVGDASPIARAGTHYRDDHILSMMNSLEGADSVVSSVTSLFTADDSLDPAISRQFIETFLMPPTMPVDYINGMTGASPNTASLVSPRAYEDEDQNALWRSRPWLWNVGYVAHQAMATINRALNGRFDSSRGRGTYIEHTRRVIDAYITSLDILSALRGSTTDLGEIHQSFFYNSATNRDLRVLTRVDLDPDYKISLPFFTSISTPRSDLLSSDERDAIRSAYDNALETGNLPGAAYNVFRTASTSLERLFQEASQPPNIRDEAYALHNVNNPVSERYLNNRVIAAEGYWSRTNDVLLDAAGPSAPRHNIDRFDRLTYNVEAYLYYCVFLPSIAASIPYNKMINTWAGLRDIDGNLLFPRLSNEVSQQLLEAGGECYPDLFLPKHPYWAKIQESQSSTLSKLYMNPDFYFYNWGFEGELEAVTDPHGFSSQFIDGVHDTLINKWMPKNDTDEGEGPQMIDRVSADGSIANFQSSNEGRMSMAWYCHPKNFADTGDTLGLVNRAEAVTSARSPEDIIKVAQLVMGLRDPQSKLFNSPVTNEILDSPTQQLSDAKDELQGSVIRNRMIRNNLNEPSELSWRNFMYIYGRNALVTLVQSPRIELRPNRITTDEVRDLVRDDVTGNLLDKFGHVESPLANALIDVVVPGRNSQQNGNITGADIDRRQRNVNEIVGWTAQVPGPSTDGGWEDTRFFNDSDTLDYSFSREGMYYMAYEGMKDLDRKKYAMRRAFPTFKVMFVEYDSTENQWRALDDFYSYNQVQSIRISRSRKVPADTCVIEFLNVSGALDGNDEHTRAARLFNSRAGLSNDSTDSPLRTFGETNNPDFEDTVAEQSIAGFVLQEGMTIMVKLGYNNDPDKLYETFVGQVVNVSYANNSDTISVVAQDYSTELVAKVKGRSREEIETVYPTTFDLLAHMMFEPEVTHFGRNVLNAQLWVGEDQSIKTNEYLVNSEAGINFGKIFGFLAIGAARIGLAAVTGLTSELVIRGIGGAVKAFKNTSITPLVGPQDDNIFVPDERDLVDRNWLFDSGKIDDNDYDYNLEQITIWDVFQEMTLRHPGFIASSVPYENSARMTMFFGLPTQRYWAKSARGFSNFQVSQLIQASFDDQGRVINAENLRQYFSLVARRYRPYRQYHILTSQTDIISNEMTATKHGVYNTVSVQYRTKGSDEVQFGDTENVDRVVTIKGSSDMNDSEIRESFIAFSQCKGKILAHRYGLSMLTQYIKDMYKGSILILGNPRIKPHDLCYVSDTFNDICGPIEVEEVVHTFSHATGFVTEVVPDAFVIASDPGSFWTYFAQKYFVARKLKTYIGHGPSIIPEGNRTFTEEERERVERITRQDLSEPINAEQNSRDPVNTGSDTVKAIAGVAAGGYILGGAAGVAPAALSVGMWMLGDYLYYSWARKRQAFILAPLIRYGSPWTVGIPWTANTSYVALVGNRIRRWWTHAEEGLAEWQYTASHYRDAVWDAWGGRPSGLVEFIARTRSGALGGITGGQPW